MSEIGSPASFRERAFYESGLYDGSVAERRAIVAWLRAEHIRLEALANKQSGYMREDWTDGGANFTDFAADAIEDCAHLAGDDE